MGRLFLTLQLLHPLHPLHLLQTQLQRACMLGLFMEGCRDTRTQVAVASIWGSLKPTRTLPLVILITSPYAQLTLEIHFC